MADYVIKIQPNDKGNPPGKLADVEIHHYAGIYAGLKQIGFSVWESRGIDRRRNVTFPARTYTVNSERRSFALLRPISDATAQDRIKALILEAYAEYEAHQDTPAATTTTTRPAAEPEPPAPAAPKIPEFDF